MARFSAMLLIYIQFDKDQTENDMIAFRAGQQHVAYNEFATKNLNITRSTIGWLEAIVTTFWWKSSKRRVKIETGFRLPKQNFLFSIFTF